MHIILCRHIRTNGLQCRAAALTGAPLCYFHTRLHQGHARYRQTEASRLYLELPPGQNIELGPLEDRESIQIAISQVINALATGQLDPKRATALLYGLQLASSNAAHLHTEPHATTGVRTLQTTPEESELPGLDLATPGAIYDTEPPLETFDDEQDEDEEYEQEIEDRVNERLAEIEARRLENQKIEAAKIEAPKIEENNEEQPETIPTLQATASHTHYRNYGAKARLRARRSNVSKSRAFTHNSQLTTHNCTPPKFALPTAPLYNQPNPRQPSPSPILSAAGHLKYDHHTHR